MLCAMRTQIAFSTLLLVACGKGSDAPATGSDPRPGAATPPAKTEPKGGDLPDGRDAEIAKLVKAGAACPVKDDDISLSCPERKAAGEYAFQKQQSKEVAATCAELVRDTNQAVKLVAAHCLERLTAVAVTPVLGHVLDSLDKEPNKKLRKQIAWGIKGAEGATAKLEERVLVLVDKLVKADEEDTAGNVLDTLFPQYMMSSGPKPPKAAQAVVIGAFARKKGGLFIRACDLVRLVEDKPAACKAVADASTPAEKTDWWRAFGAFVDLGVACAEQAPGVLEKVIADDKSTSESPRDLARFAKKFEVTPDLRTKATAALTKAKKTAPDWKKKDVDEAIAAFGKPAEPPKKI
jgi:hypothetical protein